MLSSGPLVKRDIIPVSTSTRSGSGVLPQKPASSRRSIAAPSSSVAWTSSREGSVAASWFRSSKRGW